MATIARLLDEHLDAALLTATARSYYKDWEGLAIDPSGKHTMLAYQWRSSWGLREYPHSPFPEFQTRATLKPIHSFIHSFLRPERKRKKRKRKRG